MLFRSDAKGLLLASIRDPDPVLFFEPKRAYRAVRREVPEGEYSVPLSQAAVVRPGEDVTVIAWGAMLYEAIDAANKAAAQGIDFRRPLRSSDVLEGEMTAIRAVVPTYEEDRFFAPDIAAARALVDSGRYRAAVDGHIHLPSGT